MMRIAAVIDPFLRFLGETPLVVATALLAFALAVLAYVRESYARAFVAGVARWLKESPVPVPGVVTKPLIPDEVTIAEGMDKLVADLTSDVTDEGFEWLTEEQFDEGRIEPENCWRRPFNFAEIGAEYPIDRLNDNGESLTEVLMNDLEDGGEAVVLGAPGAGKTTVCRSVLAKWSQDRGAVLHRKRGSGIPFSDTDPIEKAITEMTEENPVLVYVADAARGPNL